MGEFRITDEVYKQLKDLNRLFPTEEEKLLIDKLILNEEIKKRYKEYGLCKRCKQPFTHSEWCQPCYLELFQQDSKKNWTSGNPVVDKFIQEIQFKGCIIKGRAGIEWAEYNEFENVKYLAKGGFGTVYKAVWEKGRADSWDNRGNQWFRKKGNMYVVLKCIHNSQDNIAELFREIEYHVISRVYELTKVIRCFGITKNPETNEYMMVMEYANSGSIRQYIDKEFNKLIWLDKLDILRDIADGLNSIHKQGLIHRDFHSGNVMYFNVISVGGAHITDLGLCRPMNVQNNDVYGVLPYVAPEVLRGKGYTQKSDIYGFGIIAYEVCTGLPPYHDISHDRTLAIKICQGLRPKSNYKIPQLILDIIYQCWDDDPLKRPDAKELEDLFDKYAEDVRSARYNPDQFPINNPDLPPVPYVRVVNEIHTQTIKADEINKDLPAISSNTILQSNANSLSYTTHPQAVYTSRLLDFADLPDSNLINLNINSEDENN